MIVFFFFKQKTAYELRISDWSSDVCSSDLLDERTECGRRLHNAVIDATDVRLLRHRGNTLARLLATNARHTRDRDQAAVIDADARARILFQTDRKSGV